MALEIPSAAPEGDEQDQAAQTNPYDALVAERLKKAGARSPLAQSMYAASKIKSEDAQKALEMSRTSNLPASLILRNLQNGVTQEPAPAGNPYDRLLERAPRTAQWLKNPLNAAATMADHDRLQELEQTYKQRTEFMRPLSEEEITGKAERAARARAERDAVPQGALDVDPSTGGTSEATPMKAEDLYPRYLQEELNARRAEEGFIKGPGKIGFFEGIGHRWRNNPLFMVPIGGQLPELQNAVELKVSADRVKAKKGTEEDYDRLARFARMEQAAQSRGHSFAGKLGEIGSELPAFIMEMALTGGLGGASRIATKAAVSGVFKGVTRQALGYGAEIATQAAFAEGIKTMAGTVRRQTPLGEATVDDQGNYHYEIKDDKGEPLMLSLGKEAVSSFFDVAGTKLSFSPIYKILEGEVGAATAKTLTERLARAGKEGVKGAFSGLAINEATKLAKAITMVGPSYELPSMEDAGAQLAIFGGMGAYHGAGGMPLRRSKADAALRTIADMGKIIEGMESAGHAPATVEQAVNLITNNEPVFLKVKDVQTFYQGKGLDPRTEIGKLLGDPAKYDQAVDSDYVRLPASRYLMTIDRDKEASKFFQPKLKFDPGDASLHEITEAIESAKAGAGKKKGATAPKGQITPDQQVEESVQQVSRQVERTFRELGMKREAESYGKVIGERYRARAERRGLGELPGEVFDKERLGIFRREGPQGEIPEGEGSYVKILEQGGRQRVERVQGATPAEAAQHAGEMFPDATIEPMTPEEVKSMLSREMGTEGVQSFEQPGKPPAPAFYSRLQRTIEEKMPARASVEQVQGIIKDMKPEERKWLGVDEFLKDRKEPVDKKELLDFLKAHDLGVQDVMKGDVAPLKWEQEGTRHNSDIPTLYIDEVKAGEKKYYRLHSIMGGDAFDTLEEAKARAQEYLDTGDVNRKSEATKYGQYTLPGGENYRELLLTMPEEVQTELPAGYRFEENPAKVAAEKNGTQWLVMGPASINGVDNRYASGKTQGQALRRFFEMHGKNIGFKSGHFEERNVLAHVRFNERVDANGKKVLFLEEIQSDWHQAGRRKGYRVENPSPEDAKQFFGITSEAWAKLDEEQRHSYVEEMKTSDKGTAVPDAPFKKTWHEFALKRMIRYAAENGYDKIAWTTGEQQAERYDLAKQVREIRYFKHPEGTYDLSADTHEGRLHDIASHVEADKLEDHVGKELAKKMVAGEGTPDNAAGAWKSFSGLDLKVGGEGMKGFYDEILPAAANKLGKKYGAKVEETTLDTTKHEESEHNPDADLVQESDDTITDERTVHSMEITPTLKDAAMGEGFPLFQPGDGPPRGSIEFGPDGADINLFRGADRSTFLHESGHKWLDELITDASQTGTPEQLRGDLDTVLKWLGSDATALQGGKEIRKALTRAQQEKWAHAIEAYLLDGKAPSAALRGVFFRFSEWLKGIYRSVVGIEQEAGQKLDISPEVRDVMDRLLATDEQISEAKETEGVTSALANADWVPAGDRAGLADDLAGVDRGAKEELNRKLMEQVRKEESAQWARERKAMLPEIASEVDERPEQVALAILERGTRPDGSPLGPDDPPPIKISRQALLDANGGRAEALAGLPRRIFGKDGVSPDDAAEYFGFSSGDELLTKLRALYEPQTAEAREVKTKLEGLEMQRKLLEEEKQPLEAQTEEATKNLKAGRKALAAKLERAIRDEERAKYEPIIEILKDIKDRGGVRPVEATENLPKAFREKRAGKGVSSDEIAQELYDRGHLDSADSDALYDKLAAWEKNIKESKERAAGAPKEARRLASERVSSSIEALIENATQQERLRVQLARISSEAAAFRREHQVNQRQALIDRLADERMKEQFPDMLTDGSLPEEAKKSVYNAQRAKLMARELELLAEHKLPALKQMIRILAKRGGFSDLMRAQAEEQLAKMPATEITPSMYKTAVRKYGAEWVDALERGDWKGAFDAKRAELLNHELYRAAEKVREGFEKDGEYMRNLSTDKARARIGKAGGDFLESLDDLLERFEFRNVSNGEISRRGKFRQWYNEQLRLAQDGEGYAPEIPERVLDDAFRKNYREMTYEEFQDVVDAAKNIEHLAGLKNRLLASVDKREFNAGVEAGVESIKANSGGPRKKSLEPRAPGLELKKRGIAGFFASLRKMSSLVREMDGFKDAGPMWDLFMRPANNAGNREASMQAEAASKFDKLLGEYTPVDQLRMHRKEYIPEIGDSLTRWGQIMVALNSGNEGNLQRLRDGYHWTDQQIEAIRDRLTEKDWKFVRGTADLIESYWPEIRDLNRRTTGLDPEKVEPKPFMTKYGEMPGWYFPLKYEPINSASAAEHAQVEDVQPTLLGATVRSTTRHGHREARMEHVEKPVRLDPGVISNHLNQVIHDLTHYEFITDTNRLLRDQRMQNTILDHYGDQVLHQMKEWVKDIAVGNMPAKNEAEAKLNWIRQGTVIARLGWNLKQFITDQTGILQGAQRIGPEWVAKGWAQIGGDAVRMENGLSKIEAKSEFMRNRWRTFMREINEAVGQITQKEALELWADIGLDKLTAGNLDVKDIRQTFFSLLAKAQTIQDAPIWVGAYEKALSEHKVEAERSPADRERVEKLAVDLADQAVLDSFGGGQIKDLAQVQRGHPAWKVWMTFGSFANATLQRNIEAGSRWWKAPKTVGSHFKLAADIALVNILPAAISTAIGYALSNNPKDKKHLKREFMADQAAQILNQAPLAREFTPALHGRDYEGPAGTEIIQTGNRLLGSLIEATAKHDSRKIDWAAANQTAGSYFHYPATFVQRVANAVIESKRGAGAALKALLGGRKRPRPH